MRVFTGICRGGPYDGQQLAAEAYSYKVLIRQPLSLKPIFDDKEPPPQLMLKYGSYNWVLNQWIWRED